MPRKDSHSFNDVRFADWVGGRGGLLLPVVDLGKPTIRSVLCLALLDRGAKAALYEDLNVLIAAKEVMRAGTQPPSGPIPIPTMRAEINDLMRELDKIDHPYALSAERAEGKKKKFRLIRRQQQDGGGLLRVIDPPVIDLRTVAKRLVRDGGGLPSSSLYASYRSAAVWLSFSTFHAVQKAKYEADAFQKYRLDDALRMGENNLLGVVSLACGEGLGEAELLTKLLQNENRHIEYLAVDTSDMLLLGHARLVHEKFRKEIQSGRLMFTPVVGNIYELKQHVATARRHRGETFLAKSPILLSYLGNCIGNDEGGEWRSFGAALDAFPDVRPIVFLVGASTMVRDHLGQPVTEEYTLDPFLLETPRHLLYDLGLIQLVQEDGTVVTDPSPRVHGEFVIPEGEVGKLVQPDQYSNLHRVKGQVYRFYYELRYGLRTRDGRHSIAKGAPMMLYSIVKYDLDTLVKFFESRGLEVRCPDRENYPELVVHDTSAPAAAGDSEPHLKHQKSYAVFAAIKR